jgi:uncharacterized protein
VEKVTFSATSAVEGNTLSGIAYAFGQRTFQGGKYVQFDRGAFDAALSKSDVRAFINHDTNLLLGRQSNGTVRLEATDAGLAYSIDMPDTTYAEDAKKLISRGDLDQMSFGIFPGKVKYSKSDDGKQVQTHTSVESIFDISIVSLPAFEGTSAQLHSLNPVEEGPRSQLIKRRQSRVIKETHE